MRRLLDSQLPCLRDRAERGQSCRINQSLACDGDGFYDRTWIFEGGDCTSRNCYTIRLSGANGASSTFSAMAVATYTELRNIDSGFGANTVSCPAQVGLLY